MPDLQPDRERLASLPSLPRDEGGPVFAEPWQAQVFALAVRLSAQGHFTWKEWTAGLADEPSPRRIVATRTTAPATTNTGCWRSNVSSLRRLSRIQTRCSPAKKPGPTPTATRRMENLWHCEKLPVCRNTLEPFPGNWVKRTSITVSNRNVAIKYTAASMEWLSLGRAGTFWTILLERSAYRN
jgi:hypothetical protein